MSNTMDLKMIVLSINASGEREFHSCSVSVTEAQYENGDHYRLAEENAEYNGYTPVLSFDPNDRAARQLRDLDDWIGGAETERTISIMMADVVGDYDRPEEVPEWKWVENHASYKHCKNAEGGVWEFILNLGMTFADIPARLQPVIEQARLQGAGYVIFHQGT